MALARPQSTRAHDDLELEGIDIVITLDLSGSMQETDLAPNRLEAAKAVIRDFVRRRPTDRIGLVVFGREAYTYMPLTLDHGTFLRMLAELRLGIIDGNGTAIGNGLGVALNRLRRSDAQLEGHHPADRRRQQRGQHLARAGGALRADAEREDLHDPGRRQRRRAGRAGAAATPVEPQAARADRSMTGGTPYLATDRRALASASRTSWRTWRSRGMRDRGTLYAELYPRFLCRRLRCCCWRSRCG